MDEAKRREVERRVRDAVAKARAQGVKIGRGWGLSWRDGAFRWGHFADDPSMCGCPLACVLVDRSTFEESSLLEAAGVELGVDADWAEGFVRGFDSGVVDFCEGDRKHAGMFGLELARELCPVTP